MQPRLTIENLPVGGFTPYAGNAKRHPDWQVEQIADSVEAFGFNDPIAYAHDVAGNRIVIEGHGRLMAAKLLGLEEVPAICLDHLDDEARRAYTLAHNQLTLNTGFDLEALERELANIEGIDMAAFGFDVVEPMEPEEADAEEVPLPAEAPQRVERGQLWALGDHRLLCGDATDPMDMAALFTERPMLVVTDPPYNVAIGSKNKALNAETWNNKGGRIETDLEGDRMDTGTHSRLLLEAFRRLRETADPGASYYVFGPQGEDMARVSMLMDEAGLHVRHNLVWVKNHATFSLGRLDYDYKHEPIFYTWTDRHSFYGGYSQSVIEDAQPLERMSRAELKELVHALRDAADTSVIRCDKPQSSELHPTMKPVKLIARLIGNSSRRGDVVADTFAGSGTTIMAAEQLGRRAYCMEIDPHYCDVILERWESFTGRRAELLQ